MNSIIEHMEIDGRKVKVGSGMKKFPNYFEFGSCSLILGKNGAGKTHILLAMAEALTHGTEITDLVKVSYIDKSYSSHESSVIGGNPDIGVIYFSPIPFRRSIASNSRLVDASRITKSKIDDRMIERHRWIARALGTDTKLVAKVSYNRDIIRKLLIPIIISEDLTITDNALDLKKQEIAFLENNRQVSHTEDLDEIKSAFYDSLENHIINEISRNGERARIATLASLEFASKRPKGRKRICIGFLSSWDIANPHVDEPMDPMFEAVLNDTLDAVSSGSKFKKISGTRVGIEFEIKSDTARLRLEEKTSAVTMSWSNLSSGMISLIDQFSRIEIAIARLSRKPIKNIVLLIDEGDVYLHLDWQRKYVEQLDEFLSACKHKYSIGNIQTVLATHSPLISSDFPSCMVTNLGKENNKSPKTFANSMDSVMLDAFATESIGAYAVKKISSIHNRAKNGKLSDTDHNLISEIGDDSLRAAVLRGDQ